MSGIEVLGLVLGLVPLCTKAWKSQAQPKVDVFRRAIGRAKTKDAIQKFFDDLYWETGLLDNYLSTVVENLNLPEDIRETLSAKNHENWVDNPAVQQSLIGFFGSTKTLELVLGRITKISKLYVQLIDDETLEISDDEKVTNLPFLTAWWTANNLLTSSQRRLEVLRLALCDPETRPGPEKSKHPEKMKTKKQRKKQKHGYGSYKERVKFLSRESDREQTLGDLKKWNKRVQKIVESRMLLETNKTVKRSGALPAANHHTGPQQAFSQASMTVVGSTTSKESIVPTYSPQLKRLTKLSKRLLVALSKFWLCSCPTQHEAKMCLRDCVLTEKAIISSSEGSELDILSFDFLVQSSLSSSSESNDISQWLDVTAKLRLSTESNSIPKTNILKGICLLLKHHQCTENFGLDLIIEDDGYEGASQPEPDTSFVFPTRRRRKAIHKRTSSSPTTEISFDSYIRNITLCKPPLLDRRGLGLTFAFSLLQLRDSPWLDRSWNKEHIRFLQNATTGVPDIENPYLVTSFNSANASGRDEQTDQLVELHKDQSLQKLGIILVELEAWKRIEDFRTSADLLNGKVTPLTDINVASRVMEDTLVLSQEYKDLIYSCFDQPWLTHSLNTTTNSDESAVWKGVYETVIAPLETEFKMLKSTRLGKSHLSSTQQI